MKLKYATVNGKRDGKPKWFILYNFWRPKGQNKPPLTVL